MKGFLGCLLVLIGVSGCTRNVDYSRSLFEHIPSDPQLLITIDPNDLSNLLELAINEIDFEKMLGTDIGLELDDLQRYLKTADQLLSAIGIPWEQVESVGFLLYYDQLSVLVAGEFNKEETHQKIADVGFKQDSDGYFDYLVAPLKLSIPTDGLILLAMTDMIEELTAVPAEHQLWNRDDFREYRLNSPLDNSFFLWSKPGDDLLSDFPHRDALGDVSLALNFRRGLSAKAVVRVTDPEKAVYLNDIVLGSVTVAKGVMGSDPDYGPVIRSIQVSQDNRKVEATLTVSPDKLINLKDRIRRDIEDGGETTMQRFEKFFRAFN